MFDPVLLSSLATIIIGIFYGLFFYWGKKYLLIHRRPVLDIIFFILRILLLMLFLYKISTFVGSSSILLIVLFVSSYLGTVSVLTYKMKNDLK